ncbi:MAG: thioredoxin domain-containing protein [Flavobacteriaceae bacterium]|nr:thioredoxin domain-containing protein [Flavobacteriaceae bacterium]|tara:strand:+ start:2437 stop:4548 length:2112 start_codon:yes stop_codon:yes gene_type:complete
MKYYLTLLFSGIIFISCNQSKKNALEEHDYTNDLIHETSPYLLQHAHNPVNWKPWNEKVLEEAQKTQKLMVISIGYAACHWCHVMEKESFEDSTVASVMNKNYLSIKVDREERPDVDQTYINAVQLMTGNAGWPLNVITLPDGRPIFGGTYFKKEEWIQALNQIQELYKEDPKKLIDYANRLEEGIKSLDLVTLNTDEIDFSDYEVAPIIQKWTQRLDSVDGGSRGAPKFMMPNQLSYFLRKGQNSSDKKLLNHVSLTLEKMAYGGLYDHVGGGFARYSTDEKWHVPHFEKMLYDNAQLVSLYSEAYKATKNDLYQKVVTETLAFVAKELTGNEGVFYSSLDADSENEAGTLEEGAFYTFKQPELQELILTDWPIFKEYFNVNEYGKWQEENTYVLIRTASDASIAAQFSLTESELQQKVADWKKTLYNYREKRPKARLDDKTLTSWNALMLQGYIDAYKAFQKEEYLQKALKNASFILSKQHKKDGGLWHSYKDGKSTINGYLEDYASVIKAFLSLYEVTLDKQWLLAAKKLTDYSFTHFFDEESHMFYFTSKEDKEIISRTYDYRDNVIPSSNSIMAKNLFVLSHHLDNEKYRETASQMLKNVLPEMEKYPSSFSNWMDLLENYQSNFYEVVITGDNAQETVLELEKLYLPNKLVAGSTKPESLPLLQERYVDGRTMIYVCVNNTCKLPVETIPEALELLN